MDNKKRKKIVIGIMVFCLATVIGYFGFTYFTDEGHLKLSGNGEKEFVSLVEADKTFQEALTALDLGDRRPSTTAKRPHYTFGYEPAVLGSKSSWWTLEPGFITDTYSSIPISQSLSDSVNNNLKNSGWEIGSHNNEASFSLLEAFESERITRASEIQKLQGSALEPNCIKRDTCQQKIESDLNELNDKPLSVRYRHTKPPYWLDLSYTEREDLKSVDIKVSLTYSCTTSVYCSGITSADK